MSLSRNAYEREVEHLKIALDSVHAEALRNVKYQPWPPKSEFTPKPLGTYAFTAPNRRLRWKLAWMFVRCAGKMLRYGTVTLELRERAP